MMVKMAYRVIASVRTHHPTVKSLSLSLASIQMELGIKFRPNKPGSPHLNGKVERSQKTDKAEFYATIDTTSDDVDVLRAYDWIPAFSGMTKLFVDHAIKSRSDMKDSRMTIRF
jgi:transposase InsO family protein